LFSGPYTQSVLRSSYHQLFQQQPHGNGKE
jgi:hypothetical protein